jgi:hypothetical protein
MDTIHIRTRNEHEGKALLHVHVKIGLIRQGRLTRQGP